MEKVCFLTLGCKVNKYESDCMANILKENGYLVTSNFEKADIYVVNTCAVTNEGEKKSRQIFHKIKELNPNAKIIVCGCASEHNLKQFEDKGAFGGIGNVNKETILSVIQNGGFIKFDQEKNYEKLSNPYISSTRAYIKVQDGCDRFCSYCIIPYLRGRSRSRDLESIVKEAKILSETSKEIVLVGIDISDYRVNGESALGKLIYSLKDLPSRIRLGSFEANIITKDLLDLLIQVPNFAPHFHLSLQSGDTSVLKAMNRKYTAEEFLEKCKLIKSYFPDANITTDIIVGFPTETEKEFENTVRFAKTVGFGKIHVFPYSVRTGTVASKMKDLPLFVKKERVAKLTKVSDELEIAFNQSMLGKTKKVLFEDEEDGFMVGFTDNYIKVYTDRSKVKSGDLIDVKLTELFKLGIKGEVLC